MNEELNNDFFLSTNNLHFTNKHNNIYQLLISHSNDNYIDLFLSQTHSKSTVDVSQRM